MEQLVGNSIISKVLFWSGVLFVVVELLATIFTIFYQRYWYGVMRRKYTNSFAPKCSVIVPCKGIPKDLGKNLEGFFELDYKNYEVVFVTERENDAAVPIIKNIIKNKPNAKLAIAGLTKTCAQKNHNLLAALAVTSSPDIYVFADSDIRPGKNWLHELILPLSSDKVTVTSGFRWLNAKKGTIGELTHSYVNVFMYVLFSVACFFGGVGLWGGSMAIKRKDFDELGVGEKWSKASVDDMSLSKVVMKSRRKAVVVPTCITQSDDLLPTVRSTVSWFERQIMYLKAYQRVLWMLITLPWSLLTFALIVMLPGALLISLSADRTFFGMGGGAALVFYIGSIITVLLYPLLGTMHGFPKFLVFQPFMRSTHAVSVLRTFLTTTITWAGIKYKVNSKGEVTQIRRPDSE